jgi:hypothetical protein
MVELCLPRAGDVVFEPPGKTTWPPPPPDPKDTVMHALQHLSARTDPAQPRAGRGVRAAARVFRAADPEPADLLAVLDPDGDVWVRGGDGRWSYDGWESDLNWALMLEEYGPLVAVDLPDYCGACRTRWWRGRHR